MTKKDDNVPLPPISGHGEEKDPKPLDAAPRVDGYEISTCLGEGGMGTVWRAVQISTRREVALKVLGRGVFFSEKAVARFDREVELTARLQHPNIARIYDSGQHQGVPYYAMELIAGLPLDEYIRERHLSQRPLLEVMQRVCDAVQHAHERGVIHRDLKPSNILVTADGEPHVLDFGLAKGFLEQDLTSPVLTQDETAGTPAYMAPEQAAGRADEIDTRTDVYALGVLLFRLLTGETPHNLTGTSYEVLRRIAEDEVKRPRDITKDIDGELEALILKALASDPDERYPSAGSLAQDIENYLTNEPLIARRRTTAYFLRKRIEKYRARVAVGGLVLCALIAMAIIAYVRVIKAEKLARSRLRETEQARDKLQQEADKAKAVNDFMQDIVTSGEPRGPRISRLQAINGAAAGVGRRFADQPEVEATVRLEIGKMLFMLDRDADAETQLLSAVEIRRRVLGDEHPDILGAMDTLGVVLWEASKFDRAESIHRKVYETRLRLLGEEHPETLSSMANLSDVLYVTGKLDEAEAIDRRILEIRRRQFGEEHVDTIWAMSNLALVLSKKQEYGEAATLLRRVVDVRRRLLHVGHSDTLDGMRKLAAVLEEEGKLDDAVALHREFVEIREGLSGAEHRGTQNAMNELASALMRSGKLDEAEDILRRCLAIRERILGKEHPDTLRSKSNLDALLEEKGKPRETERDSPPDVRPQGVVLAYDSFDGMPQLDWRIKNLDPSHLSLTKKPGSLTITTQDGGFAGTSSDYENLFLIDCPADAAQDFQMTTCLSSFEPIANWNQAGLICHKGDDDYLKFVYEWTTVAAGPVFSIGLEVQGGFSFAHFPAPHGIQQVWLRMTKRGSRYTFYTSTDGETFRALRNPGWSWMELFQGEVVWGDGPVEHVGLLAINGAGATAPERDASFDFFEVRSVPGQVKLEE